MIMFVLLDPAMTTAPDDDENENDDEHDDENDDADDGVVVFRPNGYKFKTVPSPQPEGCGSS